jgi:hypothetical protein
MLEHAEPESEFQVEQVQWVFEGSQVSSCEDANIIMIKASPSAPTQFPCFLFLKLYFMFYLIVH